MLNCDIERISRIADAIKKSKNVVCITGNESVVECGKMNVWDDTNIFRVEKTYGKAPEEILSAGEFSTRKERFYNFFKKEVLGDLPKPGITYEVIKNMKEAGYLSSVISFSIFGLEKMAGVEDVIELNGSVYDYYCCNCRKDYDLDYIKSFKGVVPLCDECDSAIRPSIRLFGERIQNDLNTQAAIACQKADIVLVLGVDLYGSKIQYCTSHYRGHNLILVTENEHFGDKYADEVIYTKSQDFMRCLWQHLSRD